MADISAELAAIKSAVYGEEVRDSIRDGLQKMNTDLNYAIGRQVISVDTTLTQSGQGADAKKVGDLFNTALLYRSVVTGDTDFDTVTTVGMYSASPLLDGYTNEGLHRPTAYRGTLLLVPATDAAYIKQLYIAYTSRIYVRSRNGGTWDEWKGLSTTAELASMSDEVSNSIGHMLDLYPYSMPPYMLSMFKHTDNMFSDFCNFISSAYYGNNATEMVIKPTVNWKGWLIKVKPNTTYAIGPVDYKIVFFASDLSIDKTVDNLSSANSNVISSGSNSYWMSLTQGINRDMSDWMMVEGSTYPSTYISGYPQWIDVPDLPDNKKTHVTFAYAAKRITVVYSNGSTLLTIPDTTRIIIPTGSLVTTTEPVTFTLTTPQFISYDVDAGEWIQGMHRNGHDVYSIGWINPSMKRCMLYAHYEEKYAKTIAFFGDSITAGSGTNNCYHEYISSIYGYTCLNYGYGGSGYITSYTGTTGLHGTGEPGRGVSNRDGFEPNNVRVRLAEANPANLDAAVIFAGTNDWSHRVDLTAFAEELDTTFNYYQNNFGVVPLLVMTPIHRLNDTIPEGKTLADYVNIIIQKCKEHGIPYIDMFAMSGLQPNNEGNRNIFFPRDDGGNDGIHPNHIAHQRMMRVIGETLNAMVQYNEAIKR